MRVSLPFRTWIAARRRRLTLPSTLATEEARSHEWFRVALEEAVAVNRRLDLGQTSISRSFTDDIRSLKKGCVGYRLREVIGVHADAEDLSRVPPMAAHEENPFGRELGVRSVACRHMAGISVSRRISMGAEAG
jgi:hypothetical protein